MSSDLAYRAMVFARTAHAGQVRKYTGNPYADHLAEVAGILATVDNRQESLAVAWLHDTVEDCDVDPSELLEMFGEEVRLAVVLLSDLEVGSRADRKAASRARLTVAPACVQTIKCADLISNTCSIARHDPKFAVTYLTETRALLEVLSSGDSRLLGLARAQVGPA